MEMTTFERAGPPMPAVSRILSNYNRDQVEAFIEIAVAMLDTLDGDPDEDTGDTEDELLTEGARRYGSYGPGCGVSDGGDTAWVEWDKMRGSQKRGPNLTGNPVGVFSEDEEDDDPAGQYDEDYYTGTRPRGYGPGCKISDDDFEHDGREHEEEL